MRLRAKRLGESCTTWGSWGSTYRRRWRRVCTVGGLGRRLRRVRVSPVRLRVGRRRRRGAVGGLGRGRVPGVGVVVVLLRRMLRAASVWRVHWAFLRRARGCRESLFSGVCHRLRREGRVAQRAGPRGREAAAGPRRLRGSAGRRGPGGARRSAYDSKAELGCVRRSRCCEGSRWMQAAPS